MSKQGVIEATSAPTTGGCCALITSAGGETCVCDLTAAFDLTGPTISHHLKVLREAGLVDSQRRGTWVWYRPRPEGLKRLTALLSGA